MFQTERVDSSHMASREAPSKQVNARIKRSLYDEAEAIRAAQPFNPTWTQVIEVLLARWVSENKEAAKAKPRK